MSVLRPIGLPDFEAPPITEAVLSIQFEKLAFRAIHIARLADLEFSEYSEIEEQPELAPQFEVFGGGRGVTFPRFSLNHGIPVSRYWLRNEARTDMLQLQQDRFVRNWIKQKPTDEYPRYETLRKLFQRDAAKLQAFLAANGLGAILPNQCEIAYINSIELPDGTNPRGQLERIFRVWSNEYVDDQGLVMEDAELHFRYLLSQPKEKPFARLYANVKPALREFDAKPIVQFMLTVRGRPTGETINSCLDFFDEGRNAIVRAFSSMTREEMHILWRKK